MIAPLQSHRPDASSSSKHAAGLVRRSAEREGRLRPAGFGAQGGFTLVEVMICSLILTVGMLAIAGLLVVTTQMHVGAREAARSTRVAQDKIDDLMKLDFDDDMEIAIGGALDSNEANHFEADPGGLDGLTVRWSVAAGPVTDTRILTVRVENLRAQNYGRQVELSTIIRNW